ncbi:hypothetical protein IC229_27505 [Spirosoma sp. BT702]|uniref:Uncharacterized protein n=1 Tax=Spirosoma profusum TaxID=2771354 RepID=A0A926Y4C5_9BACT|nr:hypothetical protein [Spirosoma profusum]MBD2704418.1 hypothetical protein [Spirosoma profusum]
MTLIQRPSWLNRDDNWLNRAARFAPKFDLIDNKLIFAIGKTADVDPTTVHGRYGVKAIKDGSMLDYSKRLEWTETKFFDYLNKPNGPGYPGSLITEAEMQDGINRLAKTPYMAAELEEGNYRIPYDSIHQKWFYQYLKAYFDSIGQPMNHFGTYGSFANFNGDPWENYTGGNKIPPNDQFFKQTLQSQAGARAGVGYFNSGGLESLGVGAIIKNYTDSPDYAHQYYRKAYAADRMALGMGGMVGGIGNKNLIYLDWAKIEAVAGNTGIGGNEGWLHNGLYYKRQVGNLGIVSSEGHPQVEYDWLLGCIFMIGFTRTRGYLPFDDTIKYGADPMKVKPHDAAANGPVSWEPINGNPAPFAEDGYPVEPVRWHDAGAEAAYYYNQCDRTAGRPWQYCEYKFQGMDAWITPASDGTTILEHAAAFDGPYAVNQGARRGRPDVRFRINNANTAIDWAAFDPSRSKISRETIIVRPVPNRTYQITMQGSKLYVNNETV